MGITNLGNVSDGFAEFFGGPEKIQAHFRAKLVELKGKIRNILQPKDADELTQAISSELMTLAGRSAGRLILYLDKIEEILREELITLQMISGVASDMPDFIRFQDFFELVVPEGKTTAQVWEELRQKLLPDPVANTNFYFIIAMDKAAIEMEKALARASNEEKEESLCQ